MVSQSARPVNQPPSLYEDLGGHGARPNDFQRLVKGSELFEGLSGKAYSEWVTTDQLKFMSLMFQRRHLLEHNNGLVDQRYVAQTNDLG